jgi:hypothetical protein
LEVRVYIVESIDEFDGSYSVEGVFSTVEWGEKEMTERHIKNWLITECELDVSLPGWNERKMWEPVAENRDESDNR